MTSEDRKTMSTDEWRAYVDGTLLQLRQEIGTLTSNVGSALNIHAANAGQIEHNTRITLELKNSFDDFERRALPAVEVTETMQKGAAAVGKLLDFLHKWGTLVVKFIGIFVAVWVAIKIIISGGSWADALKAFLSLGPPSGH